MRRLLALLAVCLLLAIGLVVYALTDSAVAAWFSLGAALALPVVRFLLPLAWLGGDVDTDLDLDV